MTAKLKIALALILASYSKQTLAQDTLILAKNYRYKSGVKFISEKSDDQLYHPESFDVLYGGFLVTRRIKNTKSSFESGIYFTTKAKQQEIQYTNIYNPAPPYYLYFPLTFYYHYITIPINYRLDTKTVYFSGGIFVDYLLYHNTRDLKEYADSVYNYKSDRTFSIGYNFNLGLEKSFTKQLSIFVEARLAVTVSSAKSDGGFFLDAGNLGASNTNSGFGIGINYKILRKSE